MSIIGLRVCVILSCVCCLSASELGQLSGGNTSTINTREETVTVEPTEVEQTDFTDYLTPAVINEVTSCLCENSCCIIINPHGRMTPAS